MPIRLGVGLPAYRSVVTVGQVKQWMEFGAEVNRVKPGVTLGMHIAVDVCGVDRARNICLAQAMKNGCDWLLMIDSDTWVECGNELVRMIIEAPEDCALVGAAVRTRGGGRGEQAPLNVYRWNQAARKHESMDVPTPVEHELQSTKRHVLVDAIGAAVIAINLHRLMPSDQFKWFYYEDGSSISEDLYFCRQLGDRGEKIYVDTRMKTFHVDKPSVLSNG